MFVSVILVILIVILLLIFLINGRKNENYPPGPFPWPFVGNQPLLKRLTRELGAQHLAFAELCKRYGSDVITLRLGVNNVVIISGNRLIHTALKSEEYDGRPWNEFTKLRNLGKKQGITINDGPEWRKLRSWMMNTLKNFGFGKDVMSVMIKDELVAAVKNLKDGGVRRLKPVITPAVINVLWTLATGKRFCEGTRLQYFIDLMERRARVFDMVGGLLVAFPWIRYIAPEASGYKLLVTLNNELKGFLMETIDEHKQKYVAGSERDMIDMFLCEMYNNKEASTVFTEDQLVMVLVDLFLAGSVTTGITLDFLFLNMVVHQDVQRKLHEEIDSVISHDRLPDLMDKPKLPYAEAVICESQRLCPIFPLLGPRRVLQDTTLENYRIPKETTVLMNIHSVNIDPSLYPDPLEFKPERFIKDGAFVPDTTSLAFGKGRRRCPGEVLAKSAVFLLFVGIMQKYSLLPVPGKGPTSVEIVSGMAISPKPCEVLVVPR